ncbi:MAG TPA: 3-dehydroquinate synthase [Alphaproteobacteria bacterium]|nr:3-dehydroquinate synthase [Alphaproteobacteria bacterium]
MSAPEAAPADADGVERIPLALGARSYDILVGPGLIARAGALMAPVLERPRTVIVTDATVGRLYLAPLAEALDRARIVHEAIELPPGEGTKDFGHFASLLERLLALRIERSTTILALGGGVIGDLAGFAASVALRGIDYVQIPTTLLAQVDSSVGGKTGINTRQGKNLVGSFYQPRLVLADIDALATLPRREFLAGYAEVVKYGLIGDAQFFAWLERNGAALVAGDVDARRHAVAASCRAKAATVAADERETGARALLNFGHTFGHALEAETGFGDELLHGEAVALGMVLAFELSARLGLCPAGDAARVVRHFEAIGLPTSLPRAGGRRWNADALIDHMARDKKVRDGKIAFILARGIGKAFVARDVDPAAVRALLAAAIAA